MDTKIRMIQEVVHIPADAEYDINELSAFIDSEIALERRGGGGEIIKVDSVANVYGDDGDSQFRFPFAHSGTEFLGFIKRLERFKRIK